MTARWAVRAATGLPAGNWRRSRLRGRPSNPCRRHTATLHYSLFTLHSAEGGKSLPLRGKRREASEEVSRPWLPLTRELAKPQVLTEGETIQSVSQAHHTSSLFTIHSAAGGSFPARNTSIISPVRLIGEWSSGSSSRANHRASESSDSCRRIVSLPSNSAKKPISSVSV